VRFSVDGPVHIVHIEGMETGRRPTGDAQMACYIENNARPINDKTFATVEAAFDFARAPAWAGAAATQITMLTETSYSYRGATYHIISGENPKAARAEAKSATVTREAAATAAQVRFLIALMDRVPAGAFATVTAGKLPSAMTKAEASAAISKLQSMATR